MPAGGMFARRGVKQQGGGGGGPGGGAHPDSGVSPCSPTPVSDRKFSKGKGKGSVAQAHTSPHKVQSLSITQSSSKRAD